MSDETQSAAFSPEISCHAEAARPASAWCRLPISHWLKRLLACNPFYLVSAALLLFGMYRVSIDPNFLRTEVVQLVFNFTSLQFYELLLIGTAIVLARRNIWYDSTLLLVLDNLLVFVPFMLINQAALIEQRTVWVLCIFTALLAVGRWSAAGGWVSGFKLSPRLLAGGAVVLTANAALVIAYRIFQETKAGKWIASGAAYEMNEASWLWLLPTLCALANLLPCPREYGKLLVQRRWFPVSLFLVWIAGTSVHLYALGYIYDFPLRRELAAPALCVLAWTLRFRLRDFVIAPAPALQTARLALPLLTSLVAVGVEGRQVFFALMLVNALGFLGVVIAERDNRLARHLLFASLSLLVASLPPEWAMRIGVEFSRAKSVDLASAAYLLLYAALSRNPKIALPGAFAAALVVGALRGPHGDVTHWAAQTGFLFFLLHSLRWRDYEHPGATGVRIFMASMWVAHSFVWAHIGQMSWQPFAMAGVVLVMWWLRRFVFRNWSSVALPIAAVLVALSGPVNFTCVKLQSAPMGVLAVAGSFLFFAIGTMLALTKHRWQKPKQR